MRSGSTSRYIRPVLIIGAASVLLLAGFLYWTERVAAFRAPAAPSMEMVEMRDGTRLFTQVFLPASVPRDGVPALLMRTPYRFGGSGDAYYQGIAKFHTSRGYAFVLQDCRGRFQSEGEFDPFAGEIEDGRDTVNWLIAQDWSNGGVGTVGGSYNGYTALAAAVDNPHIKAVVVDDPATDFSYGLRGGAISTLPLLWLYLLEHGAWPPEKEKGVVSNSLDLTGLDSRVLGRDDDFWNQYVAARSRTSRFWSSRSVRPHLERICAPLLVIKSRSEPWEDPVDLWKSAAAGCPGQRRDNRLVVTAEGHTDHMTRLASVQTPVNELMLDWIDVWLGNRLARARVESVPPVRFRAPTDKSYRSAATWPAADGEFVLYLGNPARVKNNARLLKSPPRLSGADTFLVDPASMDPCSNYPNMSYVSDVLTQPLYLAGAPRADLHVATTGKDADISVLLYEYNTANRPPLRYVSFGSTRAASIAPVNPDEPFAVTVEMHSLAHEFQAGSRIAISITGSLCGYAENPHTGQPPDRQTEWRKAGYRIDHGAALPSRLVLPVLR